MYKIIGFNFRLTDLINIINALELYLCNKF